MNAWVRRLAWAIAFSVSASSVAAAELYKPFVLAFTSSGELAPVVEDVKQKLAASGFDVIGSYSPYPAATIIAVTNNELRANAAKSEFGGYGAAQRVSVTKVGDEVQVAYTNPVYMAHAYRMAGDLKDVAVTLATALGNKGEFGPEKALGASALRKYHYMFGMEYFDDPSELAEHASYEAAVNAVEAKLAEGVAGTSKVYRIDLPGKQESVFGVGLRSADKYQDDAFIMSEIDFKPIRSSAHLPYEILVSGNKVYALYARFRIAINFPDLSMMGKNSFMNIMQTPAAVEKALTQAAGGTLQKANDWE